MKSLLTSQFKHTDILASRWWGKINRSGVTGRIASASVAGSYRIEYISEGWDSIFQLFSQLSNFLSIFLLFVSHGSQISLVVSLQTRLASVYFDTQWF